MCTMPVSEDLNFVLTHVILLQGTGTSIKVLGSVALRCNVVLISAIPQPYLGKVKTPNFNSGLSAVAA